MEGVLKLWTVIVLVGFLNYLSRLSFIALFANREIPPWLALGLKYVPAAMLTALVVPMVLTPVPGGVIEWWSPKVLAALMAGAVAWSTRGTVASLATGMGALWLLAYVMR